MDWMSQIRLSQAASFGEPSASLVMSIGYESPNKIPSICLAWLCISSSHQSA